MEELLRQISEMERRLKFLETAALFAEDWTAPSLGNSWANFGGAFNTVGYWKDPFGIVHLRGLIASGTLTSAAFTLPAGYRPTATELIGNIAYDGTTVNPGRLDITAAGDVTPFSGGNTWFSLDGATFRAV